MKMKSKQGFTLIELLVVIAIIGILSGVVLTSLNTARNKAKDASAKASMSSMRAQAEISYDDNNNYDVVCSADLLTLIAGVDAQVPAANAVDCDTEATPSGAWAAGVTLNDNTFYCVDSTAYAGPTTAVKGATAVVCTP